MQVCSASLSKLGILIMSATIDISRSQLSTQMCIDGDRLQANIERLAQIGKKPNGQICRLAFVTELT